jgi:hypothetical protein
MRSVEKGQNLDMQCINKFYVEGLDVTSIPNSLPGFFRL